MDEQALNEWTRRSLEYLTRLYEPPWNDAKPDSSEETVMSKVSRDLSPHIDRFGHISVHVEIGGGPGAAAETRPTGASNIPAAVAAWLRQLADDVEAAGKEAV